MMVGNDCEPIGPLPGVRRGAPSRRTGAGRGRGRASQRSGRPPGPTPPPSPPDGLATAGPSEDQQVAPAAGGRRRMRWTKAQNANVMRAYFRSVGGETGGTGYRVGLLREFQTLEPSLSVTEQNLSDRVRFIQRRGLLSADELDQLRREAVSAARVQLPQVDASVDPGASAEAGPSARENFEGTVETAAQDIEQLRRTLEEAISEFRNLPLERRPRIPRIPLSRKNRDVVGGISNMLGPYLESSMSLGDTNSILFAAAMAVCRFIGAKFPSTGAPVSTGSAVPAWKKRIEKRIIGARSLIGRLICFRSGNRRPRIVRTVRAAFAGSNVDLLHITDRDLTMRIDDLKQRIAAWGKRIRRYSERVARFRENRLFGSDQRKFYRSLEQREVPSAGERPEKDALISFWRGIWSQPVVHREGPWLDDVEDACAEIQPMGPVSISQDDVKCALRKAPNWKTPGSDGLHTYWLKGFPACHATLARQYQEALEQRSLPNFLTTGVTHLAPKSNRASDPSQYRPITCLSTTYKVLTSILKTKIDRHIEENSIMAVNQNGCRGGGRGTKELLLIDAVVGKLVRRNRRNFSAAWIDYKKAFDSVPHTWLRRVLELYKVDETVRDFLTACMGQWSTSLSLFGERLSATEDKIEIKRGIFQGDCLSPLWFCLSLNPLSVLLDKTGTGFQFRRGGTKLSHLLYMDDLKLFAPNCTKLRELLAVTKQFSDSINMELGVDKCALLHVERGRIVRSSGVSTDNDIRTLSETETYRYLGMAQNVGVEEKLVKDTVREAFFGRLTKVLNTHLSGTNKVRAFNGWVMPVLLYTFAVLRWTQTELDALDRKVRTTMTLHRMHHPRSSMMRLYLPRKLGGRGLLSATTMHNREVCSLRSYFIAKSGSDLHRAVIECDNGLTPLSLAAEDWQEPVVLSTQDREAVWKEKELHGRFFKALHEPHVDTKASVHWLRFGDLFGETEGFVCAIQDQVVKTNNYRRYILKDGTEDICRACRLPGETIRHITSGCSALANTEYLHRHNQAARIIHQELALKYGLVGTRVPYYKYAPEPVLENDCARLYWDRPIITDRTIPPNKPDIVMMDRAQSKVFLVDVTIPHDENLVKAERDKLVKYLELADEVTEMWRVTSTEIVPVVVSTNGLVPTRLRHHLQRLGLRDGPVTAAIQRAVLLDNARIVRRFLSPLT